MLKVVLDTNVIISAIIFGGNPRLILEAVFKGKIKTGISESMLREIETVLAGKKFSFSRQIIHVILNELIAISDFIEPGIILNVVDKDPEDNKIIECAFEYGADYIVTGDIHLLEIGGYKYIKILNPTEFIQQHL